MRDFGWGHRVVDVLGGILEAFITLLAVAVIAGVLFLLVRYLLVATRAAQLYIDHHEQPRRDSRSAPGVPTDPASPAGTATTTTAPPAATDRSTTAEASFIEPTAPTVSAETAPAGGLTEQLPPTSENAATATAATTPLTKPVTKPRKPKTPPTE